MHSGRCSPGGGALRRGGARRQSPLTPPPPRPGMAPGSAPRGAGNGPARSPETRVAQAVPRPRELCGATACVWRVDAPVWPSRCASAAQSAWPVIQSAGVPARFSRYTCPCACTAWSLSLWGSVTVSIQCSQGTGMIWSIYPYGLVTTPAEFVLYSHTVQSIHPYSLVTVPVQVVHTPVWEGFVLGQHLWNCQKTRNT